MSHYMRALTIVMYALWPLSTWAAGITLGDTLSGVPTSAWASVLVLSAVSGLLALLQRMNRAMELERKLLVLAEKDPNGEATLRVREELTATALSDGWQLFIVWHMVGSIVTGAITFLFLEGTSDVNDYLEAVAIALASYGGAMVVDRLSGGFVARFLDAFRK